MIFIDDVYLDINQQKSYYITAIRPDNKIKEC